MAWWAWIAIGVALFYAFVGYVAYREYQDSEAREKAKSIRAHGWSAWKWSQDGYVRKCKICQAVQYGGDDFDGGPDASGNVEA